MSQIDNNAENNQIAVSVCCLAYNHEKYLRKCLDGFLQQKTNFKYEIIIHDDASTDRTPDIILDYQHKYPGIIRSIIEKENIYTKTGFPEEPLYMAAKGKYIAVCEGDDYWSDSQKLQFQFDALEKNKSCHLAVHRVMRTTEDEIPTGSYYGIDGIEEGVISSYNFIRSICDHYCIQTSSWFCLTSDMKRFFLQMPEYAKKITDAGDEVKLLYFGQLGDVYYFDRTMSCRRAFSEGSWSSRHSNMGVDWEIHRSKQMQALMKSYDSYTNGRYHEICQNRVNACLYEQFGLYTVTQNHKMLWKNEFRYLRRNWSIKFTLYSLLMRVLKKTVQK